MSVRTARAEAVQENPETPEYVAALLRHFADLRDGTHGHEPAPAERTREAKERLFEQTVQLMAAHAEQVLGEIDELLLLGTGTIAYTGVREDGEGGQEAAWELSWPEQREAGLRPVRLCAFYGAGFHHPHLRGSTVGEWPLNVFTAEQAAAELGTLRAIAAADLHNLVFQQDYGIVPATTRGAAAH